MKISFASFDTSPKGTMAVPLFEEARLPDMLCELDADNGKIVSRAIEQEDFKGKEKSVLSLPLPEATGLDRLILIGMGKESDVSYSKWEKAGAAAAAAAQKVDELTFVSSGTTDTEEEVAHAAFGATLGQYGFNSYLTGDRKKEAKKKLSKITFLCNDPKKAKAAWKPLNAVADGIYLTRDLTSEPSNVLTPVRFVKEAKKLEKLGLEISVYGEKDLKKMGLNMMLGVGQGSAQESHLVVMEHKGGKEGEKPLAVVGKGVCFDSGGISLKPGAGMEDMKFDMGGAGVVIGLMKSLALRKAKANVVGVLGLVENMPSHMAQRPGDVVTSLSGQTVEIINTDAEGRLVLGDALWYVQETYKPDTVIDLATLTGAIIIALGHEHAGLFCNDEDLTCQLRDSGLKTEDKLWPFPLTDHYDSLLKSDIADMKNIGGRPAGSITAAQFLKRFIKDGTKWAHIDIAGTAWRKDAQPLSPKGATGYGVRLLDRFVADNREK